MDNDDHAADTLVTGKRKKMDPAWRHVIFEKLPSGKKYLKCYHCGKTVSGAGINRMKKHLAGEIGDISRCSKVPAAVRDEMRKALRDIADGKKQRKVVKFDVLISDDEEENELEMHENTESQKSVDISEQSERPSLESTCRTFASALSKGKKKVASSSNSGGIQGDQVQKSLKSFWTSKELVEDAKLEVAKLFYDNCYSFNSISSGYWRSSYSKAIKLGDAFQLPSYYELRTNLLQIANEELQLWIDDMKAVWKEVGCTVMADGWTDISRRTLINFLVYSPRGTVFYKSYDASDYSKTANALFDLFVEVIDWVGQDSVVHIVTDNAANYCRAGTLVQDFYKGISWTPCAAHCLNLMLKDIGNLKCIDDIVNKAAACSRFIYNHGFLLNWLRHRPGWKEILRPCATRFGTVFLALHSFHDHKHDLQALCTSREFSASKLSKHEKGLDFADVVLNNRFWYDCWIIVQIMKPLMKLLRIVDGDSKPSMPYVYEGVLRAQKAIKELFGNDEDKYRPYLKIIEDRWTKQWRKTLHAAAFWLNPAYQFDPRYSKLMKSLVNSVLMLIVSMGKGSQMVYLDEMTIFEERSGPFGDGVAIEASRKKRPDLWWKFFGGHVPNLQEVAVKILGQTSSSSGCERNWSIFERIHTKKRNKLESCRLNDLVYIHYNQKLRNRAKGTCTRMNRFDPIDVDTVESMDAWVLDEVTPVVLDYEELETMLYHEVQEPVVSPSIPNTSTQLDLDLDYDNGSASVTPPSRVDFSSFLYPVRNDCGLTLEMDTEMDTELQGFTDGNEGFTEVNDGFVDGNSMENFSRDFEFT